jgi:predicted enzyme related to lactoylglutathione lyase
MPPRDGVTVTHFITVADIARSADFYEKVFGGRILSRGDSKTSRKAEIAALPGQVGVTLGIVTAFRLDGGTRDGLETVGPVGAAGQQ